MKKIISFWFLMVLVSCNAAKPVKDEVNIDNPNQHIAMAATLASFYCEQKRWPSDIGELEAYSQNESLPLPVNINWAVIKDPRTEINFSEKVTLRIPTEVIQTAGNAVSSINSVPVCEGNNVKTNFHMNIGE
jgi:hypothetical protein